MGEKAIAQLESAKRVLFPLMLLFWLCCLPLAFSIYTPYPYQTNCHWNARCDRLGEERIQQSIDELTGFFLHQRDHLPAPWTNKEHQHLREVRGMYDWIYAVFAGITLLFMIDLWLSPNAAQRYHRYARHSLFISTGLLLTALLITPFFNVFWMQVFHPLLFDNELWRTNPKDISWYLMPKAFFMRLIIFICVTTLILNLLTWLGTRTKRGIPNRAKSEQ